MEKQLRVLNITIDYPPPFFWQVRGISRIPEK
jgi:hypothetical protein